MSIRAEALRLRLDALSQAEQQRGEAMFLGRPDRWMEEAHWRCENDHVSLRYLKTERGAVCLQCRKPVFLTFPEDKDGPLEAL